MPMTRGRTSALVLGAAALAWLVLARPAQAQYQPAPIHNYNLNRHAYYPYHYFPHSYWPTNSPRWPEPVGAPYMKPPAYMAYPPFREPNWRYELFEPQRHYRGFHFWLDAF
jgi:hypothetical protein